MEQLARICRIENLIYEDIYWLEKYVVQEIQFTMMHGDLAISTAVRKSIHDTVSYIYIYTYHYFLQVL